MPYYPTFRTFLFPFVSAFSLPSYPHAFTHWIYYVYSPAYTELSLMHVSAYTHQLYTLDALRFIIH
jgi:hypothetical protein